MVMKVLKVVGGLTTTLGIGSLTVDRCQAEELPWYKGEVVKNKFLDLDWLINKSKASDNENPDKTVRKTLLLSYVRAGSSFTAAVLSSSPSTSNYYEPLFALMPLGQLDWDYFLEGAITDNPRAKQAVGTLMEGIYSCDKEVMGRLEDWGKNRYNIIEADGREKCLDSKDILVKTVRLHSDNLEPWIIDSDIKVVHLVRDPRAMISSMMAQKEEWGERLVSFKKICNQVQQDLAVGSKLPVDRYLMVKYEDIVEDPYKMFEKICTFTGIEFNDDMKDEIKKKTGGNNSDPETTRYYSTTRSAQFRHDSWKAKLDVKTLVEIECDCGDLLDVLGYIRK